MRPYFLAVFAAVLATACSGSQGPEVSEPQPVTAKERFVILGFDGVDPDRIEALWERGELPQLAELAATGSFSRLRSTQPPQSPVAWASFATGTLPGKHGIFDFVVRDPRTYIPKMGAAIYDKPQFDVYGEPIGKQTGSNPRRGEPFWLTASQAGVGVRVVNVPYSWPPEPVPVGGVASGLGVPDLRGTNSTSTVFSTDFGEAPPRLGGVRAVALQLEEGRASASLEGPLKRPRVRSSVPVAFAWDPSQPDQLTIQTAVAELQVPVGSWSQWQVLDFPLGARSARGQVRFYVEAASAERVHVYASPVSSDPEDPWVQLSHPPELAQELLAAAGRYSTVGWEEDTQALNTEMLSEEAFLQQVHQVMDQRTAMTLAALDEGVPPLFIAVWTGPDRVSHLFWRLQDPESPRHDEGLAALHGDAIDGMYRRMDAIVGQVRAKLPDDTTLVILSDHGFHPFHRGLHVNRWLVDAGYLVLKDGGSSVLDADWSRTRAYALGTGQIYVNLAGREGQGIVPFGEAKTELVAGLREELLALVDPRSGERVVQEVLIGAEVYKGGGSALAPDLQLAFASGYQSSWTTKLGGVPEELFEENPKKWSGDHAASVASETHGVLFLDRKLALEDPGIEDVAPTLLRGLGVPVPETMDGRAGVLGTSVAP